MSNTPKVSIGFSNGNLLQAISGIDGAAGLIGTGTGTSGITLGEPFVINSLAELVALGVSEDYVAGAAAVPYQPPVAAVTGNLSIGYLVADGEVYTVKYGTTVIATFTKTASETTTAQVATAIRAAINASTGSNGGFTAGGSASNVTITAPAGAGASLNGVPAYIEYPGGSASSNFSGGANAVAAVAAIAENDTADLYRHVKEYYTEVAGNQPLYILLLDRSVTMAQMLDHTNDNRANKLVQFAGGELRTIGVFRKPASGYNAGTEFMDADVPAAVTASKTFVQYWNDRNYFMRVLIEGRVANQLSPTIYEPNTAANGFAGVVLGGTKSDGTASVGLALGRRMKYAGHIKLGKVANGALSVTSIYIGSKELKAVTNLDALHGKGYISFVTYPNKAGFYFGIDNMCSTDDYRIMVHGNIIDQAAVIADAIYTEELEGEVDTNADGTIQEQDAVYLERRIMQAVNALIGERISDFQAVVDRTVNIINLSKTKIKLRVRPKGYLTFIEAELGLTAGN